MSKQNFYCRDCDLTFELNLEDNYYNYNCPKCGYIVPREGAYLGGTIWKCDAGTVRRNKIRRKKAKRS